MPHWSRLLALAAVLVAVTIVSYWPAYSADFVDFDDSDYVYATPQIKTGLKAENIWWAFTHSHSGNWHPLTWISHMLDAQMFGLDARGHHIVNVALHAVNVVLLFWLLVWLTGAMPESFLCAGLFAIHPVNVECVAWISQRKSTLSTLFALLAIWSYGAYARRGSWWQYGASLVWFSLSLMSKQLFVTLPFALLLLDYWPLRRKQLEPFNGEQVTWRLLVGGWLKLSLEKLPYLLLAIAASLATLVAQERAMLALESYPLGQRLCNVLISYAGYLRILVWPVHLAAFYPLLEENITTQKTLASGALLLVLTIAAYALGRRWRYVLVGWLWFLGTMVPMVGVVHVGSQSMADRYAYVPFWGLFIVIAWGTADLLKRAPQPMRARQVAAAVFAALLLVCGVLTYQQSKAWKNTLALFHDAAADVKDNWLAHRSLAKEYYSRGDFERAVYHSEQAIPIGYDLGRLYGYYGLALFELGSTSRAVEHLLLAKQFNTDRPMAFMNLGWIYSQIGEDKLALENLKDAADRLTSTATPYTRRQIYANWATVLTRQQRWKEALEKYDLALKADPDCDFVLRDSGEVALNLGLVDDAVRRLEEALRLKKDDFRAYYLLARAYGIQGKHAESAAMLEQAVRLDTRNADELLQVAGILFRSGLLDEANRLLEKALGLAQKQNTQGTRLTSSIHLHLGDIALQRKDLHTAIQQYDLSLADWPDNFAAANNLAWVLATSADQQIRNSQRAIALAEQACKMAKRSDHASLGTLAVAYAAGGRMTDAITTAKEAIELGKKANDQAAVQSLEDQLRLFENGQPYVESH
jgi:tetratricopeptide (TPR) repeat protein